MEWVGTYFRGVLVTVIVAVVTFYTCRAFINFIQCNTPHIENEHLRALVHLCEITVLSYTLRFVLNRIQLQRDIKNQIAESSVYVLVLLVDWERIKYLIDKCS